MICPREQNNFAVSEIYLQKSRIELHWRRVNRDNCRLTWGVKTSCGVERSCAFALHAHHGAAATVLHDAAGANPSGTTPGWAVERLRGYRRLLCLVADDSHGKCMSHLLFGAAKENCP